MLSFPFDGFGTDTKDQSDPKLDRVWPHESSWAIDKEGIGCTSDFRATSAGSNVPWGGKRWNAAKSSWDVHIALGNCSQQKRWPDGLTLDWTGNSQASRVQSSKPRRKCKSTWFWKDTPQLWKVELSNTLILRLTYNMCRTDIKMGSPTTYNAYDSDLQPEVRCVCDWFSKGLMGCRVLGRRYKSQVSVQVSMLGKVPTTWRIQSVRMVIHHL